VYISNAPVLLIRAEERRVLFGFWRGKRLRHLDERLSPSGKYEMTTITLVESDKFSGAQAKRLATTAIGLNRRLGDPAPRER
jgi:L-aminopeptidase/D-esterase-like protein